MGFVRDLAGLVWADNRFVRRNRVLRTRVSMLEAANERLSGSLERTRERRAMDRDVRVRAETEVAELTKANSKLSGMLFDAWQAVPAPVDPVAVGAALAEREEAAQLYRRAHAAFLEADALYRNEFNRVYIGESGPEHVRKAVAEEAAAGRRALRDEAEVARVSAEQSVRLAELGFRAAMAGAVPDDGGES